MIIDFNNLFFNVSFISIFLTKNLQTISVCVHIQSVLKPLQPCLSMDCWYSLAQVVHDQHPIAARGDEHRTIGRPDKLITCKAQLKVVIDGERMQVAAIVSRQIPKLQLARTLDRSEEMR